ncbi:hypothetical protein NSPZN2_11351 [Nitrospira defluvii]|uniref:Uncharacterized protein n=1 Tax=Nitrospira defluvii TaxID=330214 RepID=A0ABN7KXZ6_9BACT|nr:hypothetical protein NSPZN2_11351 [Nitrospira defluvii]
MDDGDGDALTVGRLANDFDRMPMGVMGAMGKIQARRVHAALDQLIKHSRAIARRTDGADDFSFTHGAVLLS